MDRRSWIRFLGADSGAVCPDLVGHGSKQGILPTGFDHFVEDLRTELKPGAKDPVMLVGHSLGGWVAARWAALYPDEVVGLVLVAPALAMPDHFLGPFQQLVGDLRARGMPALLEFVDGARPLWFPEPWASAHPAEIDAVLDIVRDQDAQAQARVMEVLLAAPDCAPGLEAADLPVAILRGLADPTALTVTVRPDDHVDIDGAGHFLCEQAPAVVREQIRRTHMRATLRAMLRLQYRLRRPDLAQRMRHPDFVRLDAMTSDVEDSTDHVHFLRRLLQRHDRIDYDLVFEEVRNDRLFVHARFLFDDHTPADLYGLLAFRDGLLWRSYNDYEPLWPA
ncbi:MAG: alpha/beta fold hydrolase [Alphaproteobacteria bacterium]|nr:alpha/beta fold hydrolase [Alphaproteobacteria bacterium]